MTHCNAPTPGENNIWGSPEIIFKTNENVFDFQKPVSQGDNSSKISDQRK